MFSNYLEPQTAAVLARAAEMGIRPIESLSPEEARRELAAIAKLRPTVVGKCSTRELRIAVDGGQSIRARLYLPTGVRAPAPVVVYFHGGGHVLGSIDTHDDVARRTALAASTALVSVEYRKAPETRFPTSVDDAWQALRWITESASELGLDATRVAVMGDSAGANLAAVAALLARDENGPAIALQILVYPVVDYRLEAASFQKFAAGYGMLSTEAMQWFRRHYLRHSEDANDWRASPILAPNSVGLPPTLVIAAECDPLIDDIQRYVRRLQESGVQVDYVEYPGTIHGFFAMPHVLDAAYKANARVATRLRAVFSPHPTGSRDESRLG